MATILTQVDAPRPAAGGYKVDISRGERIGRVSSEWFSRPDDERFLSLTELHTAVKARAERATTRTVETREVRVEASRDNAERLALIVPGRDQPVTPTHWSFGQIASLVGAPAGYLRQLPAPLAGINMQHGLLSHRAELMKTLRAGASEDGGTAKLASDLIGGREVERGDVSRSQTHGRFTTRSMSMQTRRMIEDVALASEIMQLPNREGFLKRATGLDWRRVSFPYSAYTKRVSAFDPFSGPANASQPPSFRDEWS